jgi:hypothetical protein
MHLNIGLMPIVPLFLFKLSVSLTVVWGFYRVVLRRLTFYGLNRCYLLGYTLLSFYIPLINIGPILPAGPAGEPIVLQFIPAIGGAGAGAIALVSGSAGLSVWTVLEWMLAAGSVLMLARVIVPLDLLKNLRTDLIASIRVLKDSSAMKKYGEKGKNGVVLIYLKGMKGTNAFPKDVLYFVDGREMAWDSVVQLNTDDIESIIVLKGIQAQAQYGEKGRNGVILIALKHPGGEGVTPHGQDGVGVDNSARVRIV